jgi:hypothetical protein
MKPEFEISRVCADLSIAVSELVFVPKIEFK